ncbi:MAG: hypothetical protein HDR26_02745 [Lachnospiraceae bacterium]|nr:hypothetical protein [Lachnospiraceae bacterium]
MSNYQLKAEVSRLESQLREIERENSNLRSEINSTISSVNQAERNLTDYNQYIRNTLDNATNVINNSINRTIDAYELQGQIDQLYTRYKRVELANKKIRALNNKKYYDFNNYRTVRKIVQGMMDNLDLNMVSEAVIYKSIERQHLLTPDYWLTCVLISIMAWTSDDRILAERALENAIKLDLKSSSIFYMIFNLRMDRNQSAVKWFLEYQKCELKGSDENTFLMLFSLISKTLSDNVDEETSRLISDYIHRLIVECAEREGYREEDIIHLITDHMRGLAGARSYDLPLMAKYCKDYGNISKMLNLASNNYNILEFILRIVNVPVAERNTYLKEYLNELLAKPNDVEIETYNEIEYNELLIQMSGDADGAKARFDEEMKHKESNFNIISTIIQWLYDFSNEDVNGQMRLNMFTLVKALQEKAAESYFNSYRGMYSTIHPVGILDYTTDCDFENEVGENNKIQDYYDQQQSQELSKVKNGAAYGVFAAGLVCGVAAFFVHLLLLSGFGVGAAIATGILISNRYKRKNIVLRFQKQKSSAMEILHNMFIEYGKMKELYKGFDDVSGRIIEELAKL